MSERDAPKCPLGEDCDLTAAYLAGFHKRDNHVAALTADRDRFAQEVERLSERDAPEKADADFLVMKNGLYYRPNASGYTMNPYAAGRYTLPEATRLSHPNGPGGPRDGMTVVRLADEIRLWHERGGVPAMVPADIHAALTADRDRFAREVDRLRGAGNLIVELLDDGFRCRSCGYIFIGRDGHDDCPMGRPNWDRLTIEQIADAARAALQGETD